jgi:hypothetical protein
MNLISQTRKIAKDAKIHIKFRSDDIFPIHPILGNIATSSHTIGKDYSIPITINRTTTTTTTSISNICEPVRDQKWIAEGIRDEICDEHRLLETITLTSETTTTPKTAQWTLQIMGIKNEYTTRMKRQVGRLIMLMGYYLAYTLSKSYPKSRTAVTHLLTRFYLVDEPRVFRGVFDAAAINGGCAYQCRRDNEITIFRIQEAEKVWIHEWYHASCGDRNWIGYRHAKTATRFVNENEAFAEYFAGRDALFWYAKCNGITRREEYTRLRALEYIY